MKHEVLRFTSALGLLASMLFSAPASADVYTFNFTGRMTIADSQGNVITGGAAEFLKYQTPISASLTYDSASGLGASPLSITVNDIFFGQATTFHDITLERIGATNLFNGQLLVDWSTTLDMRAHIEWDATGLMNAIDSGLMQVGDKISGDALLRDPAGDHTFAETVIASLGSATPYSDTLIAGKGVPLQYAAPLAATFATQGIYGGTPFDGLKAYLDIGSGNSMYVTSISPVPEPASWASTLAGLAMLGLATRRRLRTRG